MNYFINHSTRDKDIISPLCKALEENAKEEDKTNIAFSSIAEKGTKGGDSLMPWINKNLEESDIFIAIITENYVRSQYCLYELNIALYLYSKEKIKKIIPICSNENIYLKYKTY